MKECMNEWNIEWMHEQMNEWMPIMANQSSDWHRLYKCITKDPLGTLQCKDLGIEYIFSSRHNINCCMFVPYNMKVLYFQAYMQHALINDSSYGCNNTLIPITSYEADRYINCNQTGSSTEKLFRTPSSNDQ